MTDQLVTTPLVEVDLGPTSSEDQLREIIADLEQELTVMTADRDAADRDLDTYVKHVNRLDRAVIGLHDAVTLAGIESDITDAEISEIIAESLARSKERAANVIPPRVLAEARAE